MLGPIIRGDKSILEHDLTHGTSGLDFYPAFDAGWTEGDFVIAPETVKITRHSGGSHSGWSLYADGESGLRYYVTHLRSERLPVGVTASKGFTLGRVGNFVGARVPHAHVGVNAERILGPGKQLRHNTNYTHGQPSIGRQLPQLSQPPEDDMPPWFMAWLNWRLFDGGVATRPKTAPEAIPQPYLDIVKAAERFRAEKPVDNTELIRLRGKLKQINELSG